MNRVVDSLARYVDWLGESYRASPRYLGLVRIAFAAYVMVFPIGYSWTSAVPVDFLAPRPGILAFISGAPADWLTVGLEILRFVAAAAVLVGYRTGVSSVVLTATMVLGSAVVYSFGKVDHFILFETLPLFLAAAGWGQWLSIDSIRGRRARSDGFPVLLLGTTIAFAMATAAYPKVRAGWLDPEKLATRGQVARDLSKGIKDGPVAAWLFQIDWPIFWKGLDYATVFAEGWLFVALLAPVLFRVGIAIIIGFHIGVFLTLGIDFSSYFLVYAVFFSAPVSWLWRRLSQRLRASTPERGHDDRAAHTAEGGGDQAGR